jgi:hypothetical protein
VEYIRAHRDSSNPFDVVVAGQSAALTTAELADYERVGVTWWLEAIPPNVDREAVRDVINAGPMRAEHPAPWDGRSLG